MLYFYFYFFVETSQDSSMPSSLDTSTLIDYNQDDFRNYSMDDNKFVDEHRLMCMESQLMSDSVCPTNVIGCTNTSKKYSSIQQTERHKGIHNDEKVHNCSTCDKCFPLKSHLNVHPPKHTSEKSFKCSSCDKCFTWKGDLKNTSVYILV